MASMLEQTGYVASEPGRVAVLVALAQSERAVDELSLAQVAGLLYQRITGEAIETAAVIARITDLAARGLLRRDSSGFRWELTALGTLVSRPWAPGGVEPPGNDPLPPGEVRAWRDRLIAQIEEDAALAEAAAVVPDELLASQTSRLAELRVLNRILGEERLPDWLSELA